MQTAATFFSVGTAKDKQRYHTLPNPTGLDEGVYTVMPGDGWLLVAEGVAIQVEECPNCDGQLCMPCVLRQVHDRCELDSCPECDGRGWVPVNGRIAMTCTMPLHAVLGHVGSCELAPVLVVPLQESACFDASETVMDRRNQTVTVTDSISGDIVPQVSAVGRGSRRDGKEG